ncbi:hypothetical protein [Cohnella sp. AR92]|uniref:hypothetical protein n=1 Tax=Cohnella sp. AR92 TaxID=648716 RepID=UPI000F8ECC8D|nr:hypothetical protein [Cohnella sp. AR92]RUS44996.1 hypothetical protein ELR57_22335 [Cohnella sp. AR92]
MISEKERDNLNIIFQSEAGSVSKTSIQMTTTPTATTREASPKKDRKERSDKLKDIKFPVTPRQREELRRRALALKVAARNETISNTKILIAALNQHRLFPEQYPELVYEDTKQYMHAEPTLAVYDQIVELSMQWNVSIRKAAHRLIMNYIFRGEVLFRGGGES